MQDIQNIRMISTVPVAKNLGTALGLFAATIDLWPLFSVAPPHVLRNLGRLLIQYADEPSTLCEQLLEAEEQMRYAFPDFGRERTYAPEKLAPHLRLINETRR